MSYTERPLYEDRADAGRVLATRLRHFHSDSDALILALPRGGVPVALEISRELEIPMNLLIVRKLGVPGQEELAMGAVASGDIVVLNRAVIHQLRIPKEQVTDAIRRERLELARREQEFRGGSPELRDRKIILVDDGLATGSTMQAAVQAVRSQSPRNVTVAVPVAAAESCARLRAEVDALICVATPPEFGSVGAFYRNFSQTTDAEVRALLDRASYPNPKARTSA